MGNDLQEMQTPAGLLPIAPAHLLRSWEDVFASIDKNRNGEIESMELTSLVNEEFGKLVCRLLNPEGGKGSFKLNDFLFSMCWAHGYCPPAWLKTQGKDL